MDGVLLIKKNKIRVLIVLADYYKDITDNLVSGAIEILEKEKIIYKIIKVPGALEIAQTIKFFHESKSESFDGFVALGCVIKGDTYHFEIVSNESARALSNLSINFSIPISNGILTTFNRHQALDRSKINKLNKGREAALACLSMIKIKNKIN